MKGNGLSSTSRGALKKLNRQSNFASNQVSYLAEKEKQRSLRLQAEKAWIESQKRGLARQKAETEANASSNESKK
jgi:hypothetical protein